MRRLMLLLLLLRHSRREKSFDTGEGRHRGGAAGRRGGLEGEEEWWKW